jgi:hypothetical protein
VCSWAAASGERRGERESESEVGERAEKRESLGTGSLAA